MKRLARYILRKEIAADAEYHRIRDNHYLTRSLA